MTKNCNKEIQVLGLSGAKKITESVCKHLKVKPLPVTISHFADGEIMVRPEVPVRNRHITIVQSLSKPVNENLMELLIAIDSLKRASAQAINVIIAYYAYARQDRKTQGREPITSKLVAMLLEKAGATRVAIVDIHSEQTQGFFDIPVDTLRATNITAREAVKKMNCQNLVVVSPDYGGVKRARSIASLLEVPLAILDKRRPTPNQAEITNVLGNVRGKDCLISDDMIDTAGTIVAACKVLKANGAKSITIAATHAILSEPAVERLQQAVNDKVVSDIYLTNSIESVYDHKIKNLHIVDLGKYLSEIIEVYYCDNLSISEIYNRYEPKVK
ncbi:MAG: ribose-phosphate pyrophosphokinase [Mycoplasmataceae bacterium]|jgi:ribose-phosphate pyrophosphokinase|nr:ribose-phosphate pyrophosphokinase [Mycoplasmataceae bacterium]